MPFKRCRDIVWEICIFCAAKKKLFHYQIPERGGPCKKWKSRTDWVAHRLECSRTLAKMAFNVQWYIGHWMVVHWYVTFVGYSSVCSVDVGMPVVSGTFCKFDCSIPRLWYKEYAAWMEYGDLVGRTNSWEKKTPFNWNWSYLMDTMTKLYDR